MAVGSRVGCGRGRGSVGGAKGVPDPACRGKAWVKPITALDAYLRIYQIVEFEGQAAIVRAAQPAGFRLAGRYLD